MGMTQQAPIKSQSSNLLHEYWAGKLSPENEIAGLVPDYQRPTGTCLRDQFLEVAIPEAVCSRLAEITKGSLFLAYSAFMTACKSCLFRYSGSRQIVVGSPMRRVSEHSGHRLNAVAISNSVHAQMKFQTLLEQVRQSLLEAYQNQTYPFEQLLRDFNLSAETGGCPLFNIAMRLEEIHTAMPEVRHDIEINFKKVGERYQATVSFSKLLYKDETIQAFWRHFVNALTAGLRNPATSIQELPIGGQDRQRQILEQWNHTAPECPRRSVHQLFRDQALKTPDATALEYKDKQVTYAALDQNSDWIAGQLLKSGAQKQDVVAIFVEDRVMVITAMIGILKSGCAFMPVSPSLPKQRIRAMLEECAPQWAIVEEPFQGLVQELNSRDLNMGVIIAPSSPSEEKLVESSREPEEDGVSYIFFTSGSTGRPKAIAGQLKAINHFIHWEIETFGIDHGSRVSQLISPMFDAFLRDVFVPLCRGGTLCIPEDLEIMLFRKSLGKWIDEQRIALMHTVPSVFRLMLAQADPQSRFNNLRHVLLAGETLLPSDVKRWHEIAGSDGGKLVNLYGPTETTMTKFVYRVEEADQRKQTISIGKPMTGAQALLVDAGGGVCPAEMMGEIYIRTPYRSLGYFQRPDLTREVFVPNPFGTDLEDIVYKTADLGRLLPDGNFELAGRRDQQVKIRGVRIELAEIETALSSCEGIEQTVVVAREDQPGNKYLAAYVVCKPGCQFDVAAVRKCIQERLPEYMMPSRIVELPKLPLLPNGKLDRMRLPNPDHVESHGNFVPPANADEEILCRLFAEVLKREQVSAQESFFELGGHSLLAVMLMSKVQNEFQVELPLGILFEADTPAALAKQVQLERQASATVDAGAEAPTRKHSNAAWSSVLIPVQPKGSLPPLFCAHPVLGLSYAYIPLAQELGTEQPVYCFQSYGLEEDQEPLTSIEAMAEIYIKEMRGVQPHGPYHIAGFSMGCVVAYEIARQVRQMGEEVGLLAVLDGGPVEQPIEFFRPGYKDELAAVEREVILKELAQRIQITDEMLVLQPSELLRQHLQMLQAHNVLPPDLTLGQIQRISRIGAMNHRAKESYRPQPYDGDMLFLTALSTSAALGCAPDFNWKKVVQGRFDMRVLESDHPGFIRHPNVKIVAELLKTALEQKISTAALP